MGEDLRCLSVISLNMMMSSSIHFLISGIILLILVAESNCILAGEVIQLGALALVEDLGSEQFVIPTARRLAPSSDI